MAIATFDGPLTESFPPAEAATVEEHYGAARIVLEYGSGRSTVYAAKLPGKFVVSVESDFEWALALQQHLDSIQGSSHSIVWHVDIGPTGKWGRPLSDEGWRRYHRYPLSVWHEPFFKEPDLILIDGRFRAACLIASLLRVNRPTTVLFDDYVDRPAYHVVERFLKPAELVGRMAIFQLTATAPTHELQEFLFELCSHRTLAADEVDYTNAQETC